MTTDAVSDEHEPVVRSATFAELSPQLLYAMLRLREAVFVVEQQCPYPELDGRDDEAGTRHWWVPTDGDGQSGVPGAYLRTLTEDDGATRIGRVVTAPEHRGRGWAARLVEAAVAPDGDYRLDAQADRSDWYGRFGFSVTGAPFDDFGILHVPMTRLASAS